MERKESFDMDNRLNRLGRIYEKTVGRLIPMHGFFSVIFCFVFNSVLYFGLQVLMRGVEHHDFTSSFDRMIPFVPAWSIIYLGCYVFWGANYILVTRQKKEEWFQFATADYLSRIVCAFFFIVLPTTNVRPEVVGTGLPETLMRFVYRMDDAANLFPSIHCLVSWFCFIGIRGREDVPKWYQGFSCIFAFLVFASTLFTKQHYIIDVIAGVFLAEICYYIGKHTNIYIGVMKVFDRINHVVFWERIDEK